MSDSSIHTFFIFTLGCKANQYDGEVIKNLFNKKSRIRVVDRIEDADLIIFNSCTVTGKSDRELRQLVYRAKRQNPSSFVVVTGCAAQTAPSTWQAMKEVDLVVLNEDKFKIVDIIAQIKGDISIDTNDIKTDSFPGDGRIESRSRAFLKIQDGCNMRCSYCIVPYARGTSRSDSPRRILDRLKKLKDNGIPEVVLTGIHLGHYQYEGVTLTRLLELIEQKDVHPRVRLSSLDPHEITEDMLSVISSSSCICNHLHIAIQSGSTNILRRMNRPYDRGEVLKCLERIFKNIKDPGVGADLLIGFPGETEKDFKDTLTLFEDHPFTYAHVFPYSRRPGTAADKFSDQIQESVKKERCAELRRLAAAKKEEALKNHIGSSVRCIFERGDREGAGFTRNYLPVRITDKPELYAEREITAVGKWVDNLELIVAPAVLS